MNRDLEGILKGNHEFEALKHSGVDWRVKGVQGEEMTAEGAG